MSDRSHRGAAQGSRGQILAERESCRFSLIPNERFTLNLYSASVTAHIQRKNNLYSAFLSSYVHDDSQPLFSERYSSYSTFFQRALLQLVFNVKITRTKYWLSFSVPFTSTRDSVVVSLFGVAACNTPGRRRQKWYLCGHSNAPLHLDGLPHIMC